MRLVIPLGGKKGKSRCRGREAANKGANALNQGCQVTPYTVQDPMGGERLEEVEVKLQRSSLGQRRQGKAFLSRRNKIGKTCDHWSTTPPRMLGKFFVTGVGLRKWGRERRPEPNPEPDHDRLRTSCSWMWASPSGRQRSIQIFNQTHDHQISGLERQPWQLFGEWN